LGDDHGGKGIDVRWIGPRTRGVEQKALALAIFAALWAAVSGCGGGGGGAKRAGTTAAPPATATTAPRTATSTATPSTPAPPPASTGGGGGSEPIRIPATFTLRSGRLSPRSVMVPPFLAVAISVRNLDSQARTVTIRADRTYRLTAGPGGRAARLIRGQRAGAYPVTVSGGGRATLVVGGEPGP
jgi:hypothetical protein